MSKKNLINPTIKSVMKYKLKAILCAALNAIKSLQFPSLFESLNCNMNSALNLSFYFNLFNYAGSFCYFFFACHLYTAIILIHLNGNEDGKKCVPVNKKKKIVLNSIK